MKQILLLLVFFLSFIFSNAGTNVWTADEDDSASRLFTKYCSGSANSGIDGHIFWTCKRAQRQTPQVESYLHIFDSVPLTPNRKQIIFVENSPNQYKHMILIQGGVIPAPKTNIYVLPGRDTHTLTVKEDIKANITAEKPSIFFVKGDITENTQGSRYRTENDDKDSEYSDISAATAFEYTKHPQPPAYVKRRRVKAMKIIREKRNYGGETERSQTIALFQEKPAKKNNNNEKSITLHYRRRNPARFGYNSQKQYTTRDDEEEYAPAASSYYTNPYQHLRPVYIRPQI